jgi:hypothetical protein
MWQFGTFLPVSVFCTKKIWQPCISSRAMHSCRLGPIATRTFYEGNTNPFSHSSRGQFNKPILQCPRLVSLIRQSWFQAQISHPAAKQTKPQNWVLINCIKNNQTIKWKKREREREREREGTTQPETWDRLSPPTRVTRLGEFSPFWVIAFLVVFLKIKM